MTDLLIARADILHLPLADDSVDLVFCSPPYEDARTYGIDFRLKGEAWVNWAVAGYLQCLRVCRGLVAWVVEGKTNAFRWSATPAILMAELHRRGVRLRKPAIFARVGIPGSGGPDWLRNDHEIIVCATRAPGRLPWSDNTAMGHPPKWAPGGEMSHRITDGTRKNQWGGAASGKGNRCRRKDGRRDDTGLRPSHVVMTKRFLAAKLARTKRRTDGTDDVQSYSPPVLANPGNIIRCTVGGGLMGSPLAHENEAPFPESLAEFFIRSFCPPGGTVLDPFSGSGTTAAVALRTNRNAIAFDLRASQCSLTRRRCSDSQPELAFDFNRRKQSDERQDDGHF